MRDTTVYILRCGDGSYYVGRTTNLERRLWEHATGVGADYTRWRRPVALVWHDVFSDDHAAWRTEQRIKGWSRAKKEALIRGDGGEVRRLARRRGRR